MDNMNLTSLNSRLEQANETTHRMDERKLRSFEEKLQKMEQTFNEVEQLMVETTIQKRILGQIENVTWQNKSVLTVAQKANFVSEISDLQRAEEFYERAWCHGRKDIVTFMQQFPRVRIRLRKHLRNMLTENDTTIVKVFYISTINMVDVRTENGKRALANFTVLHTTLERQYLDINSRNSRENITPS